VVEVLVLLILAIVLFAAFKLSKVNKQNIAKGDVLINDEISADEVKVLDGYTNIALFGVDSREGNLEIESHSDCLMIASINNSTKEVKLVSVYRDTYLDNTNGEYRKATECYYFGGA
jgi:anionic cell wall polymer biosynthesis LytR-Cps2A-Psr (LCP) family protein